MRSVPIWQLGISPFGSFDLLTWRPWLLRLPRHPLSNRSEPSVVDAAAHEFAQSEDFIRTAEKIMGQEYVWGRYDSAPRATRAGSRAPSHLSCEAGKSELACLEWARCTESARANLVSRRGRSDPLCVHSPVAECGGLCCVHSPVAECGGLCWQSSACRLPSRLAGWRTRASPS